MILSSGLKDKLFYGWVVVFAFWVIGIALYGVHFSFGVFFKSIESEFGLTRAATSTIVSVNMILAGICSFLAGWALDRYGPKIVVLLMGLFTGLSLLLTSQTNASWQLFLTYSLLLAMGAGPLFVVPMSTVSRWFDKKRGLALGLSGSGIGLGPLIIAPLATYLITGFSWRVAYLVIGLLAWLLIMPLVGLLKRDPREIGALPDGAKAPSEDAGNKHALAVGLSLRQAYRTRSFWLFMFTWVLYATSLFLVITHLVPHATDIGFTAMQAATVISMMGLAAIPGRILMGIVSDWIGRKATAIICTLLQGGAMAWLLWAQDLWALYLFGLAFGFAFGGMSPAMAALIGNTFGMRRLGTILGVLEIGLGVGAAIGPAVGGFIYDTNHSYFLAFLLEAVALGMAVLLIALVRRETNEDADSEVRR